MFGSLVIDAFLGLILIYTFLSLGCMTINEWIAAIGKLRANNLKAGIASMVDDPKLVDNLYNHPLIFGLWKSGNKKMENTITKTGVPEQLAASIANDIEKYSQSSMLRPPSYIPPKQLTMAVVDLLRSASNKGIDLRQGIEKLPNGPFKYALLSMLNDAKDNIDIFQEILEGWFNDGLDRISGWYKRNMQVISFVVGLVVTVVCNADTFQIVNGFYHDGAMRNAALTVAAEYYASGAVNSNGLFPLGWGMQLPSDIFGWFHKLIGWLITAVALSLGSSFWFDILTKVVNIRLAGKKPV